MRDKTCCFTGHRDILEENLPAVMRRTETKVRELIAMGVTQFFVGGAIGYDTLAAEVMLRIREEHSNIQVILAYPFQGFTASWTAEQKENYARILPQYSKTVCVAPRASKGAYLARDRYMVDHSAFCIAYCNRDTGGTAYTVRYAQKHGLAIYNIAEGIKP